MKWDEMTPIERDALVAGIVLKRHVYKENTWGKWLLFRDDQPGLTEPIPPYTTSLDAAWLVLKEMVRREEEKADTRFTNEVFEAFSDAMFHAIEEGSSWGDVYPGFCIYMMAAQWTPDMICLAALKACGVEIERE